MIKTKAKECSKGGQQESACWQNSSFLALWKLEMSQFREKNDQLLRQRARRRVEYMIMVMIMNVEQLTCVK